MTVRARQKTIEPLSIGIGDRFGRQGEAQLRALITAREHGIAAVPVWNKSNREHKIVGTTPPQVRFEAEAAVAALGWTHPFHVDADHVNRSNVDAFIQPSDFFTIDVADWIGKAVETDEVRAFVKRFDPLVGSIDLPGGLAVDVTPEMLTHVGKNYLAAVREAAGIFQHIAAQRPPESFVVEVSMDETDRPQSPEELLFILAALADAHVPLQTIAPRFEGRFNKGVDYVGDTVHFEAAFDAHTAVVQFAAREFELPGSLKLSVHSGSDKFSIYPAIRRVIRKRAAGLHLKTAGTTWLEEIIGLAESGGDGLTLARELYRAAWTRRAELVAPYAAVVDILERNLPDPDTVDRWTARQLVDAVRHVPSCHAFNPDMRQLLHVGYKVAAEMGDRYLAALDANRVAIGRCVTGNLLDRHILPLFGD